jgi:predicted nuclease of predicted toxin-antitoxin system
MPLRFFFDECADEDVARGLRRRGIDVVTVTELGRKTLSDEDQLEFARRTGRVTYTTDRHFLTLVAEWLREGIEFPGVVYHVQGVLTKGQATQRLLLLNEVLAPSDMVNRVEFL